MENQHAFIVNALCNIFARTKPYYMYLKWLLAASQKWVYMQQAWSKILYSLEWTIYVTGFIMWRLRHFCH